MNHRCYEPNELIKLAIEELWRRNNMIPKPEQVKELLHDEAGIIVMSMGKEPWQSHFQDLILNWSAERSSGLRATEKPEATQTKE